MLSSSPPNAAPSGPPNAAPPGFFDVLSFGPPNVLSLGPSNAVPSRPLDDLSFGSPNVLSLGPPNAAPSRPLDFPTPSPLDVPSSSNSSDLSDAASSSFFVVVVIVSFSNSSNALSFGPLHFLSSGSPDQQLLPCCSCAPCGLSSGAGFVAASRSSWQACPCQDVCRSTRVIVTWHRITSTGYDCTRAAASSSC
jgi:hypothetical protein